MCGEITLILCFTFSISNSSYFGIFIVSYQQIVFTYLWVCWVDHENKYSCFKDQIGVNQFSLLIN